MIAYYRTYELAWEISAEEATALPGDSETGRHHGAAIESRVVICYRCRNVDFDDVEKVPPRFAKLILEQPKPLPPPPIVRPEPEEVPELEPKIVEETMVEPEPIVEAEPIDRTRGRTRKASVAGLLPFAEDLADLRDNQAIASVIDERDLAGAAGAGERVERSLITSRAGKASGGINTAGMSRNTGGSGLGGHNTAKVSSAVAGLGGGGGARRPAAGERPARSREEIEMVFDENKGAIYALYNRALRRDPSLQGKLVLRLTIEPSGVVSFCEIVSSEIEDEALERKLIQRVKMFRFLEKDVDTVTTTKPIDFFPA